MCQIVNNRIVVFLPSLQQGGVVRTLLEAFDVIDVDRYDITVYVYSTCNAWGKYLPEQVKLIVDTDKSHYHRLPRGLYYHFRIFAAKLFNKKNKVSFFEKKLHDFVHSEKAKYPARKYFTDGVDIAISYNVALSAEMAANIRANRRYLFFHSCDPYFHRDITKRCFDKFDNIIAVGTNVRDILIEAFPEYRERIALIRNYLDGDKIQKLANEYYPSEFSDYTTKIIIASVIRVDKEKGADLIVKAATLLKATGASFIWFIVGDGYCKEEIVSQISKANLSDNIIITGFKDNPYPYIKHCDIFVHPTYEESFGLSILEALILSKAVVSTNTVGAKEVLENGKYGLLVSPDPESVFSGIIKVVNDPELKYKFENGFIKEREKELEIYRDKWDALLNGKIL